MVKMALTRVFRALVILFVFEALGDELTYIKFSKHTYHNDCAKGESLVVIVCLNSKFRASLLAGRQTNMYAVKHISNASRIIILGKQSLRFMKYALAAIILQRSGDVALLLNPGPIELNLPKNQLHFGQLNVNGLRNKTHEVKDLLINFGMHFLGLTETKLDDLVLDGSLEIEGYRFLKRNRNGNGGGVG